MRTCDAKQAPCSSMNLIRGLSLSLRTAIGLHAVSFPLSYVSIQSLCAPSTQPVNQSHLAMMNWTAVMSFFVLI